MVGLYHPWIWMGINLGTVEKWWVQTISWWKNMKNDGCKPSWLELDYIRWLSLNSLNHLAVLPSALMCQGGCLAWPWWCLYQPTSGVGHHHPFLQTSSAPWPSLNSTLALALQIQALSKKWTCVCTTEYAWILPIQHCCCSKKECNKGTWRDHDVCAASPITHSFS